MTEIATRPAGTNRQIRRDRLVWLAYLLFFGFAVVVVYLIWAMKTPHDDHVPVGLHSVLFADYSADPRGARLPGVEFGIIEEVIADQGGTDASVRFSTLQSAQQTPVPTITPRLSGTPTTEGGTPTLAGFSPTATGTQRASQTPTKTATPTVSATARVGTSTATHLGPTSTRTPTGFPSATVRTPTHTPDSDDPTNTPRPPTDTPQPPTDTPLPPTDTSEPPTSEPPTDTPEPPTHEPPTPEPPTDTPDPYPGPTSYP